MKRNTNQLTATCFFDGYLVGHLLIRTNRRYQMVEPEAILQLRLSIGFDLLMVLVQMLVLSFNAYGLFCTTMDPRWNSNPPYPNDSNTKLRGMVQWYQATLLLHKLLACLLLLVSCQMSILMWHRSMGDMLGLSAVVLDLSLAFILLGFYAVSYLILKYMLQVLIGLYI